MKRRSGWSLAEAVTGVLLIALGVLTWCYPGNMLAWITVLYGVLAVWMGVGDILLFIRWERYTGFAPILSLISGILSVMCGIMLIVYPDTLYCAAVPTGCDPSVAGTLLQHLRAGGEQPRSGHGCADAGSRRVLLDAAAAGIHGGGLSDTARNRESRDGLRRPLSAR